MAAPKPYDHSLMVAAMAYRVKYRKVDSDGKTIRIHVRVDSMGVHKKNRGGVYPAGVRCKSLVVEVVQAGFLKEEVSHVCIAVEEVPLEEFIRGGSHVSLRASAYNAEQSGKDELLCTCFAEPYDEVRHPMLSHNHMMLILRAFLSRAKWDLPRCEEKGITFCDDDGRLSVTAVAASANGKELGEVLVEGIPSEVLSWKMDVEQPDAASIISQALNHPQQMAMRTSELTAVAVLKGEIIVQLGKDISQRVAFQTVRDRVRNQLANAADDPDLPEVFDFLISCGVGTNGYVEHLLEWTTTYVDSKKRQLRFVAFAVVNLMCAQGVWSKQAVIKRAYRQKPANGFCPSPEAAWGTFKWSHLSLLEEMLRFFHVSCKDLVDALPPQSRILLLGNADVAAAEAFWAAKDPKLKAPEGKIQEMLLAGAKKYMTQLGLEANAIGTLGTRGEGGLKLLVGYATWIRLPKDIPAGTTGGGGGVGGVMDSAPLVIKFDEKTGAQLNQQVEFAVPSEVAKVEQENVKLPWREWRSGMGTSLGQTEADQSAAVAVLHGLHVGIPVEHQPIEVWQKMDGQKMDGQQMVGGCIVVTATGKVEPRAIVLPPCVPNQSKVHERSEHPHAVALKIRVIRPSGPSSSAPDADEADITAAQVLRTATCFVNPEFKPPKREEHAAVAVAYAVAVAAAAADDAWEWRAGQTMPPFWAVRRMNEKQLAALVARTEIGQPRPRFNCTLEEHVITHVTVGVVKAQPVNTTRMICVPFLSNSVEVAEGEELILQVAEPKQRERADKRRWIEAMRADEKAALQETKKRAAAP
jgi:hypothetical protein